MMLQGVVVPSRQMRSAVWPTPPRGYAVWGGSSARSTNASSASLSESGATMVSIVLPTSSSGSQPSSSSIDRPTHRKIPSSSTMAKGLTAVSAMARYIAGVGSSPTANSTCSPGSTRGITPSICVVTIGQNATVQNPRTSSVAGLPTDRHHSNMKGRERAAPSAGVRVRPARTSSPARDRRDRDDPRAPSSRPSRPAGSATRARRRPGHRARARRRTDARAARRRRRARPP